MAGSVNKAVLIGHVGKDPLIGNMGNGKPKASFSLATSESWRDKNSGERKERTAWHQIVVFNEAICRTVEHYVKKGSQLYIEGKILTRKYQKDGEDKYTTEIVLDGFNAQLTLLDKREGGPPPADGPDDYGTPSSRPQAARPSHTDDDGSTDIPF